MNNNFLLKLSKFFIYLVPFCVIVVSRSTVFPFIVGKYVFFRIAVELALIFFVWAWATGQYQISLKHPPTGGTAGQANIRHQIKKPLVIAVALFVIIFVLAGFFGYNPSASFWSNFERGEGGLQMLHLFIFFALLVLLFKDEKSWRKLFVVSLWAGGLMIIYGLAAALGIFPFIGSDLCSRFAGSLGNPAYIGTYMIFVLFYAAFLANGENKKNKKWILIGLMILFFLTLLFSQTRGALLGLGAGIFAGLFYLFFQFPRGRTRKIILAVIVVLMVLGGLGFKFRSSVDLMPFCKGGGNRILDVGLTTETFQTRTLLWQQALKITAERPLLGWGPENFSPAFEKYYDYRFSVWYDRAHSVYFDYLAETGILGLLSYLGIFAVFYRQFFKTRAQADKNADPRGQKLPIASHQLMVKTLLFALPIAYLIQGIVLFDVLPVYINLFLFLAFANYKFNAKSQNV